MVKLLTFFLLFSTIFAAQSEKSFERMLRMEGFRALPYDDVTGKTLTKKDVLSGNYEGKPHIGYGVVIPKRWYKKAWLYNGITKAYARRMAKKHPVRVAVNREVKRVRRKITQDQEDVLHEAGYNIGPYAIRLIIRTLNKKGPKAAANHLLRYNRAYGKIHKGLVKRRKKEAKRLRGL